MNKFDLIHKALQSTLKADDKNLLIELILLSNDQWESWPSVERLCQVRGIKHEKNFKGVEHYLPGLVSTRKVGRRNHYILNTPAVEGLSQLEVSIKHTPPLAANTPAVEGAYTPAVAENTPAVEGANSTTNNTLDSTEESTTPSADAPVVIESESPLIREDEEESDQAELAKLGVVEQLDATTGSRDDCTSGAYVESELMINIEEIKAAIEREKASEWDDADKPLWDEVADLALDPSFHPSEKRSSKRIKRAEHELNINRRRAPVAA